jgi:hypothetical protein
MQIRGPLGFRLGAGTHGVADIKGMVLPGRIELATSPYQVGNLYQLSI